MTAGCDSFLWLPGGSVVTNPPANAGGTRDVGWEGPLEKGMTAHSSVLAWSTPQREESGGLRSMGSQRVRRSRAHTIFHIYPCDILISKYAKILPANTASGKQSRLYQIWKKEKMEFNALLLFFLSLFQSHFVIINVPLEYSFFFFFLTFSNNMLPLWEIFSELVLIIFFLLGDQLVFTNYIWLLNFLEAISMGTISTLPYCCCYSLISVLKSFQIFY